MGKDACRSCRAFRSNGPRLVAILGAIGIACIGAAPASARTAAINLQLTPGVRSIAASWGVSSTYGLSGFRVRWRLANNDAALWSTSVELSSKVRTYVIDGLKPRAYEVRVRARMFDKPAGARTGEATALKLEEAPAPEEEVHEEEPVFEEEPAAEEGPSPEAGLEPVWYADPINRILEDWANIMAEPGRVVTTPFAAMPGGFAYSDEIRNGDNPAGYGERAEIAEGNPIRLALEDRLFDEGQDRWIAFPFMLGSDFPINTKSWYVLAQIKQLGSMGTPILSIGSNERGGIALFNSDTNSVSSGNITRWSGELKLEQLNKVVLHVKFSPDPAVGFVELYGDCDGGGVKLLMSKTHMSTMKQIAGIAVQDQARIGQYRDQTPQSGTSHVYYGRYVVADSREVAEAYAFE